jgi:hypothetical protein
MQPLGAKPSVIDTIDGAATHADDAAVFHADIHTAAVGAQDARGLDPAIGLFEYPLV